MSWRDATCLVCAAIDRAGRAKKTSEQGITMGTEHMPTAELRWIDMFFNAWSSKSVDKPVPCCAEHEVELSAATLRADQR